MRGSDYGTAVMDRARPRADNAPMELLAPAGSAEKLRYAYRYGADAAYIGLPLFSLRAQAENIDDSDSLAPEKIRAIKEASPTGGPAEQPLHEGRKLYCAANVYFQDDDLAALEQALPRIEEYPFDAFIVSDLGAYDILRNRFPDADFHLSTQANATNWRAAKLYRDMGFSRIVPGRELSLDEIKTIKDHVPELEIEAFVHGAMCMSYSGRCFISSWLAGRSANRGDCTHSCRWHYKLYLEEEKRPGQMIPVESGDTSHGGYNLLMSSRDLCMIDHIGELAEAGIDSIKIEGRMKSLYYVALVARAYRFALDNPGIENPFRDDLFSISHREYDTGFFFGRAGMDQSAAKSYRQTGLFAGSVEAMPTLSDSSGQPVDSRVLFARFREPGWSTPVYVDVKNTISAAEAMEVIGPDAKAIRLQPGEFRFFDCDGLFNEKIRHGKAWFLQIAVERLEARMPGEQWLLRIDAQPR